MLQKITSYLADNGLDGLLFVGDSSNDSDMYYLSHFVAIDRFAILMTSERVVMLVPKMEQGRALKESSADEVVSTSEYNIIEKQKAHDTPNNAYSARLANFLHDQRIRRIGIATNFAVGIYQTISKEFDVKIVDSPVMKWRAIKDGREIEAIKSVQRSCEEAMGAAIDIISKSTPKGSNLYLGDRPLTAELIRNTIEIALLKDGCEATDTIVAGGNISANPHSCGCGPLPANAPIVIDISPRSKSTRFFADMTRTVLKGEADLGIREIYDAVLDAQKAGLIVLKAGITGEDVHFRVSEVLAEHGYSERENQGFIHSTGHGVGLMLHELPNLCEGGGLLQNGNVVTVEPGLYYPDLGGVRLEDLVVVKPDGCDNLTRFERRLVL